MGSRNSRPPPSPPPPPPVPPNYRNYNSYSCPEYHVRNFPKNTETILHWACGANCPGGGVQGACSCLCQRDSPAARANTDRVDREQAEAEARAKRLAAEKAAAEAAERERQRLAALEAERKRKEAEAAAAKAAAEAAARARAKADAKALWDAAQVLANAANALWEKQKGEYATATNAVPPLKLVYDNAQSALDGAKAKKIAYDDAVAQQTEANKLLTAATDRLVKANSTAKTNIEKTFADDSTFMKNAAGFQNATFGIDKQYDTLSADWAAYTAAKAILSKTDAAKVAEVTTATDKLIEAYTKFGGSKGVYSNAVINALKSNKTDADYVKNSKEDADTYGPVYGLTNEYNAMVAAWTKVTNSVNGSDAAGSIVNYIAFLPTKTAFGNALLIAQNKRAEADFQTKLAAGKDAAAKWAKSAAKGCRNMQTVATTDPNMLDQDIECADTEYISGYATLKGFESAPIDENVNRDNIGKYLAVKYSCCTAPAGAKGTQGKKGLPGLEGSPGPTGPPGPEGAVGPAGKQGPPGEMGEEGGKGPRGEQGDDGPDGKKGQPGRPGKSYKAPLIRQLPGPRGMQGEEGPMGQQGPRGPDGIIKPAPVHGFSELDRTIALFDVQEKINNYLRG